MVFSGERTYTTGNFAPIQTQLPLTPCSYEGEIPNDLAGGEYVRNGANPLSNEDLARDAHWFDGDGMLTGVLFQRSGAKANEIRPHFVNRYLMTDLHRYEKSSPFLRRPVMPSITTLIDPCKPMVEVVFAVLRAFFLIILSRLPGRPTIKRTSVANTSVVFHDGRALATCESGPPLRFALPELQTIGWFDGVRAENEPGVADRRGGFGGDSFFSSMGEWTTGHPRVDPETNELIAFHSTFVKPYIRYSIVKSMGSKGSSTFNAEVPGVYSPKLMHDFGVSSGHTVIMDLPLILDPTRHMRRLPSMHYDVNSPSRFGVFPRYSPKAVQWFETKPCLIFHTANCWDTSYQPSKESPPQTVVNLLACRLTSSALIFSMGNSFMPEPQQLGLEDMEGDHCRLYYYSFPLSVGHTTPQIQQQWALSAIPFEFPTVSPLYAMRNCRYIYGCSSSDLFTAALGRASKIDYLVKVDIRTLIARGIADPPQSVTGCVDDRSIFQCEESRDEYDPIKVFHMPKGWYAQEARFVPRLDAKGEDDGWLLSYVFDELQLDDDGQCLDGAVSELWIIDARNMKDVVAKVKLPQRVPYGLHGDWFSEERIAGQRPFDNVREFEIPAVADRSVLGGIRDLIERWLG